MSDHGSEGTGGVAPTESDAFVSADDLRAVVQRGDLALHTFHDLISRLRLEADRLEGLRDDVATSLVEMNDMHLVRAEETGEEDFSFLQEDIDTVDTAVEEVDAAFGALHFILPASDDLLPAYSPSVLWA